MEALAALSLACNVVQLVDAAKTITDTVYQVYKHGSSINNEEVKHMAKRLDNLKLGDIVSDPDLSPIAADLKEVSNELLKQLASLESPRRRDVVNKTYQTWRKTSKIEKLQVKLDRCQRLLDTGLLAKLSERHHADAVVQSDSFGKLDATLQRFIGSLANGHTRLEDVFKQESSVTRQHITSQEEETRALFRNVKLNTAVEQQKQRFLGSFKFPTMNARRNQISENHPKTFQWIFEVNTKWPSFKDWLASDEKAYLVEGKAASGKSTLMKYVADHLETRQAVQTWSLSVKILSHYFWLSGDALQRNMRGFLCSIVYQILKSDDDALSNNLQFDKDTLDDWSLPGLTDLAKKLLGADSYCFFVDGLDEFDRSEDPHILRAFINDLIARPNIKMCMSTRPEQSVFVVTGKTTKIQMQELTNRDIHEMVVASLTEAQELGSLAADQLKAQLIDQIVYQAQGVFLWVKLALRSVFEGLQKEATQDELLLRITRLPSDLTRLYEDLLHRPGDDLSLYRSEASLYLQIAFLGYDIDDAHITSSCQELMTMTFLAAKHLNQLQDFHYTGEFLLERLRHTARRIQAVSGGLLEVKEQFLINPRISVDQKHEQLKYSWTSVDEEHHELMTQIFADRNAEMFNLMRANVVLIHRTARDFLLEQPLGQSILKASDIDSIELLHHLIEVEMAFVSNLAQGWAWNRVKIMSRIIQGLYSSNKINEYATIDLFRHLRQSVSREACKFPGHESSETDPQCDLILAKQDLAPYQRHYRPPSCAIDFPGLFLETGSSLYFEHFVKPLLGLDGGHRAVLSNEYIDYLLLCASLGCDTSEMIDDLLHAGANMDKEFYLPPWLPCKATPAMQSTTLWPGVHAGCSAECSEVAAKNCHAPRILVLFSIMDRAQPERMVVMSKAADYQNFNKVKFELIVEAAVLRESTCRAEDSAEFGKGNKPKQPSYKHLVRRLVLAVGSDEDEVRQVSSEEDSQLLLKAYDKFCLANGYRYVNTSGHLVFKSLPKTEFDMIADEFHDDIKSIFDRLNPITNWWKFLVSTGWFKETSDPTITQCPIKRFRDGVDPADYPDL